MVKAFSDSEKELIGRRLLEQGYKQFSAHGLKKTNVEEIARAAGISKGAFYRFYESKEGLFMDVVEQVEIRMRQELLAMIDVPGPSPRARLYAILINAFQIFKTLPILRVFTGGDFDLLFRRIPADKFQEHLASDQAFIEELVTRCQGAGIPIQVPAAQMVGLLYPLVLTLIHEEDLVPNTFTGNVDLLVDLIAAYCLGEVEALPQHHAAALQIEKEGHSHEPVH